MSSGSGHSHRAESGWTAFDLKQRRKHQGVEAVADNHDSNPYPSLSDSGITAPKSKSFLLNKNNKPFSSLLVPSIKFSSLEDNKNFRRQLPATTSSLALGTTAHGRLKDLHPWADESLIQDVLAGVSNNVDEALSLLEAMVITVDDNDKIHLSCNDFVPPDTLDEKENMINDPLVGNQKQPVDEESSLRLLDIIKSLPIEPEPEWGGDDVYIIYRKDAIRMMRYYISC